MVKINTLAHFIVLTDFGPYSLYHFISNCCIFLGYCHYPESFDTTQTHVFAKVVLVISDDDDYDDIYIRDAGGRGKNKSDSILDLFLLL